MSNYEKTWKNYEFHGDFTMEKNGTNEEWGRKVCFKHAI